MRYLTLTQMARRSSPPVQGRPVVAQLLLRELTLLCAARQRLALAGGVADEGHPLLGSVPLDLMFRVCEEAQAASALEATNGLGEAPSLAFIETDLAALMLSDPAKLGVKL